MNFGSPHFKKLGAFYRKTFLHGPVTASEVQSSLGSSVLSLVAEKVPKKPMKNNYLNQYMKMHWKTLMKDLADQRLASAMHAWNKLKQGDEGFDNRPVPMAIRRAVAQEFWETESAEVKESVLQAAKADHATHMAEWSELKEEPKTPAQFYQ